MVVYVLEASSLLRFLDREAGSNRVAEILTKAGSGACEVVISAVNWGEVIYTLGRRNRLLSLAEIERRLDDLAVISIVPVSSQRASQAAAIKLRDAIPFADCFAVQLASESEQHILVTADFDMVPAADHIRIEFLPPKPRL